MVGLGSHHANNMRQQRTTSKSMIKGDCDDGSKQWYTLVKLDEYGGVGHVVSDEELRELEELILSEPDRSEEEDEEEDSDERDFGSLSRDDGDSDSRGESEEERAQSEDTSAGPLSMPQMPAYQKPGGPCDHCGAVDSPQWRRGPASKPMLCNACGTRYRRTNNLGPPTPLGRVGAAAVPKKRTPPASPSSLNPAKKARCAPSLGGLDRFTTAVRA